MHHKEHSSSHALIRIWCQRRIMERVLLYMLAYKRFRFYSVRLVSSTSNSLTSRRLYAMPRCCLHCFWLPLTSFYHCSGIGRHFYVQLYSRRHSPRQKGQWLAPHQPVHKRPDHELAKRLCFQHISQCSALWML